MLFPFLIFNFQQNYSKVNKKNTLQKIGGIYYLEKLIIFFLAGAFFSWSFFSFFHYSLLSTT
jgi:hypothetical protein